MEDLLAPALIAVEDLRTFTGVSVRPTPLARALELSGAVTVQLFAGHIRVVAANGAVHEWPIVAAKRYPPLHIHTHTHTHTNMHTLIILST